MSPQSQIDQIADRVERLLLRYAELQLRNAELEHELLRLGQERNALRSRLQTALGRLDALLEQLAPPPQPPAQGDTP